MRKLKNLLIAVVAIAMLTAVIPVSAAVTVSGDYLNMQFATSESYKTNSADPSTALTFNTFSASAEYSFEEILNSGTAKFTMEELGSDEVSTRMWYIGQQSKNTSATGLDNKVTWYELSFKFDTAVSGISLDAAAGKPIFYIEEDGHIYLDPASTGYSGGTKVTSESCVAGKWYHLVIAYDYVAPYKVSDKDIRPQVYAFLNGQQLASIKGSSRTIVTELNRVRLYSHKSSTGNAVKYVDNFKIYTTDNSVETDLESGAFDPMDIYDGTEITSNSLIIADDKIYVDTDTTLQEVEKAIEVTTPEVYYDGTTAVADDDMATTTAVGKTVYVRSTGGIGVKAYTIDEMPAYMLAESYLLMNYEASTNADRTNSAGTTEAFGIDATQCNSTTVSTDMVRNSKAGAKTVTAASDKTITNSVNFLSTSNVDADISNRTAWYELSFKMETLQGGLGLYDRDPIFGIAPGGTIYLLGLKGTSVLGQEVTNAKIDSGKWYHMVVAVDHLDKGIFNNTENAKIYAWLNGKLLKTNTADSKSSAIYATSAIAGGNKEKIDRVRVQLHYPTYDAEASEQATETAYIDNCMVYTTYTPVLDSEGNYSIDPLADYAKVSSGTLTVVDDAIYAAENASFDDIYNALTLIDADAVVDASGTNISGSTAAAKDSTIYVRSESGIGINTYTVKTAPEYGIITDTAVWTVADGKATLTTYFSNRGVEKGCVLILASYDSDGIVNVCTTDIDNVPAAGKKIVSNPIEIGNSTDLTIRAFVLNSMSGLIPLTTVCDSLPAYAG